MFLDTCLTTLPSWRDRLRARRGPQPRLPRQWGRSDATSAIPGVIRGSTCFCRLELLIRPGHRQTDLSGMSCVRLIPNAPRAEKCRAPLSADDAGEPTLRFLQVGCGTALAVLCNWSGINDMSGVRARAPIRRRSSRCRHRPRHRRKNARTRRPVENRREPEPGQTGGQSRRRKRAANRQANDRNGH